MLKSLCIKTNNEYVINYLLKELETFPLNNVYISKYNFKIYTNIIIHYKGKNLDKFFDSISNMLYTVIIKFYESKIIKNIINSNYFYFTDIEQKKILDICIENLSNSDFNDIVLRKKIITNSFIEYFTNNKALILDGFIKFRLNNYIQIIDNIIDNSVTKFVIDREYSEFIDLLKSYINSKETGLNIVHLIYNNQESILLDEFKDIIDLDNNILNTKYISDITFSSNDFALNTLLTLLPKKIYIHIINKNEDEFINTLKLIFDNRIYVCNDCSICKMYKAQQLHK